MGTDARMKLIFEDSVCGYEHGRTLSIYFLSANRYFYREYASDCGYNWFNCGFLTEDEALELILEFDLLI